MEKKIAIIGAGMSGLVACKHTMEKGLSPIVFEAQSNIGGVWSKTIESTRLQSPKSYFQFSDFAWPSWVKETFPDHNQVMSYLQAYAMHFNILPKIKFNTKVINVDYILQSDDHREDIASWDLWGGSGEPFSSTGKWNVTVQDARDTFAPTQVYQVDFVILCIGRYGDLPNMPDFPIGRGPEVYDGVVMHSMDYAAMENDRAAEFVKGKRVIVVGFQKSAIDIAAEVANINGSSYPCLLLFKRVYWTVPEHLVTYTFRGLNRFSEYMVHKPGEGWFLWLLAILLSPLIWIFSKLVEYYLRCLYPLKKYKMIPSHSFFNQITSCKMAVTPSNFYEMIEEKSLILKKCQRFSFCKDGFITDEEGTHLAADVVIFATGYKSDEKLKNIFASVYFQKCIIGTTTPFYRECIHPRIPNLAILGYAESAATLYTTEMRSKWISHFLAGNFRLPSIREMEDDVMKWEKCMQRYVGKSYKRFCVSVLLHIYCNDQLCNDMGYNSRRKAWFLPQLFAAYGPADYKNLSPTM